MKKDKYIKVLENAANNQKSVTNIETQNNTQNMLVQFQNVRKNQGLGNPFLPLILRFYRSIKERK